MGELTFTPIPRVVDLSHYDNVQDSFEGAVKAGIWGVINKVTEGTARHDPSFGWRRNPVAMAGLRYGAYHFLHAGNISLQADWFLSKIGDFSQLLVAVDHEANASLDDLKAWMTYVKIRIGRWPWLYSGFLIKEQLQEHDPFFAPIKLWLAEYNSTVKWPDSFAQPLLIQYTGDGVGPKPHSIEGIEAEGGLDINHFAGTRIDLGDVWAK